MFFLFYIEKLKFKPGVVKRSYLFSDFITLKVVKVKDSGHQQKPCFKM